MSQPVCPNRDEVFQAGRAGFDPEVRSPIVERMEPVPDRSYRAFGAEPGEARQG
jgi:hypothetical protein